MRGFAEARKKSLQKGFFKMFFWFRPINPGVYSY
jgi:hypothetical protein